MTSKNIAILTGGGDCPGLNSAIKSITQTALENNYKVLGIQNGWQGLSLERPQIIDLNFNSVAEINHLGGTILGSSRTNPYKSNINNLNIKNLKNNFKNLKLNTLISIGGEDTLGVAARLFKEENLPIIGVPKTIDLDLPGTDYTLGFESALERITQSIDQLRSTAKSHNRIFVVEVMGRHAGHLALQGGISAGADIILIPEVDFEVSRVIKLLKTYKSQGANYNIIVISEGAKFTGQLENLINQEKDSFGHMRLGGISNQLAELINQEKDLECRAVNLSHLQRGGSPVSYDRRMGFMFGVAAIKLVKNKQFGHFVSFLNNKISSQPLSKACEKIKCVNIKKQYDTDKYRAKRKV